MNAKKTLTALSHKDKKERRPLHRTDCVNLIKLCTNCNNFAIPIVELAYFITIELLYKCQSLWISFTKYLIQMLINSNTLCYALFSMLFMSTSVKNIFKEDLYVYSKLIKTTVTRHMKLILVNCIILYSD